jgi:hypothetical protein
VAHSLADDKMLSSNIGSVSERPLIHLKGAMKFLLVPARSRLTRMARASSAVRGIGSQMFEMTAIA